MKKQYETPEVKKIEFDYTENVVASANAKQTDGSKCNIYTDPCTGETKFCNNWSTKACSWG